MNKYDSIAASFGKIVGKLLKWAFITLVLASGIHFGLSWSLHECGMCGARTFETWYAGPDCPVCSKCYDELRYND